MLCGTTYFSPSLPMFAFVLDAGNVACLLLWTAGRVGRACVFRGTGRGGAERRWAERRWAKRRGLVKCVGDNCPAHRSHRLTVHRYKKSTLHLYSYFSKDIRSPGTFSSMCSPSVCQSVSLSVPSPVLLLFGNVGSLTLTLPGTYRSVRTDRYGQYL